MESVPRKNTHVKSNVFNRVTIVVVVVVVVVVIVVDA